MTWVTYYRLGKNRPGSGILSRCSRSALRLKATAATPTTKAPMTAVLTLQLAGWAYQPPAGDQTSLGYLRSGNRQQSISLESRQDAIIRDLSTTTHCEDDAIEEAVEKETKVELGQISQAGGSRNEPRRSGAKTRTAFLGLAPAHTT